MHHLYELVFCTHLIVMVKLFVFGIKCYNIFLYIFVSLPEGAFQMEC